MTCARCGFEIERPQPKDFATRFPEHDDCLIVLARKIKALEDAQECSRCGMPRSDSAHQTGSSFSHAFEPEI